MIVVTRLNGTPFGVNPDLLQRIDSAPDTILTLVDGTKLIVSESMVEIIGRINEHRSQLLARAQEIRDTSVRGDHLVEVVRDLAPGDDDGSDDGPLAPAVQLRPRRT